MRLPFFVVLFGLVMLPAVGVQAQSRRPDADMRNRFGAKLMFGLGGELDPDPGVDVDLETTYGLGLSFESPFHDYVTAGGIVALRSWHTEAQDRLDLDRSTMLDISAFIKARYPTRIDKMAFEPYVMIPLGLSVSFTNDDTPDNVDTGFGWNSGLLLGAILFVTDTFGVNAELGYVVHNVSHNVDVAGGDRDLDLSLGQVAFNLGIVVAID